jgi:hypothetical protein
MVLVNLISKVVNYLILNENDFIYVKYLDVYERPPEAAFVSRRTPRNSFTSASNQPPASSTRRISLTGKQSTAKSNGNSSSYVYLEDEGDSCLFHSIYLSEL